MSLPYDVPPVWPAGLRDDADWQAAIELGIDVTLLEENLRLTPADRIRQLDDTLDLAAELQHAAKRA